MWAFKTLHDKGLVYEGFRVLAYCWRCETPLSNTETRMDDVYRDRQDPALTVWFQLRRAGATESDRWSGPPRRGRCRPTWPSPSARTSSTPCCEQRRRAVRRRRGPAGRVRQGAGGLRRRSARCTGADAGRAPLHAAVRLPGRAGRAERVPGARRRLRHHRGRHRRRAPGARPSARTTRTPATPPASRPSSPWTTTPGSPRWSRRTQGLQVFEANKPVIRDLKERGRGAAARHLHPLLPALLALRHPAGLQGGVVVVRRGDQVPGPDGRAEPADHLDAGAHQGRLVRQVAGQRPGLVDQPEPVLGLADPGVEVRRPAVPAGRRLRLARRARARLRRARSTDLHRPDDRRADPAQPGRPDRAVDDAPGAGGAGLLVRVRLDAVRPGALPVRERGLVRAPLPGRLHRRVHRADPRLVLHHARAGHRAVRPAGVPQLREPRHPARRRTAARCPRACATTRTCTRCSTRTARTRCAGC